MSGTDLAPLSVAAIALGPNKLPQQGKFVRSADNAATRTLRCRDQGPRNATPAIERHVWIDRMERTNSVLPCELSRVENKTASNATTDYVPSTASRSETGRQGATAVSRRVE